MVMLVGLLAAVSALPVEHRGIWLHPEQFSTPQACDEWVQRMAAANLNAAYALVWYYGGRACWRTALCARHDIVTDDYDPLAYLIRRCHENGIAVHAWFVNGKLGAAAPTGPLASHEDWLVETSPGVRADWWDFGKPEVREMEKSLMLEVLRKYDVDGVHFDYIRYDGPMLCFCDHCRSEFKALTGYDIGALAGDKFPLTRVLSGNPVDGPATAQVLVRFKDGPPAIALNQVGKGQVLLLNWHAERHTPPAVSAAVKRFLEPALGEKPVYLHMPEETRAKYTDRAVGQVAKWLRELGLQCQSVRSPALKGVAAPAAIVLVTPYYLPNDLAATLLGFVEAGSRVVVVDGPVYSIREPAVSKLIGMSTTSPFFSKAVTMVPETASELIETGGSALSPEEMQAVLKAWSQYRKDTVSKLVEAVFREAKAVKPKAAVTAAVFHTRQAADGVFQDWPRWLRENFIDYVLPMAYMEDNAKLAAALGEYREIDPTL
ncbi:MAG: family 10 glycosylhydrolase, partial [Armatimonadetes bacterium]|nr:family 10 glycosylhydrolase [Armatimonadota bacterium]